MSYFDEAADCNAVKIAYWGPERQALYENLQWVQRKAPGMPGALTRAEAEDGTDAGVYVYKRPWPAEGHGVRLLLHLYAAFGRQVTEDISRFSLRGADAFVFVAPGDRAKAAATREAFEFLRRTVAAEGCDVLNLPLAIQLDQGGNPADALQPEELRALLALPDDLEIFEVPDLPYGIGPSFDALVDLLLRIVADSGRPLGTPPAAFA